MRRRGGKGAPSADLLVCFPSRAHLTLMPPKPICSPSRPSEPKRHQNNRHHHQLKKAVNRGGGGGGGKASPLLWAKPKLMGPDISEPTSPKVTCAGQIRVRSKPNSCKNWQSVMEEIEKLHNNRQNKKRLNWVETLGFKKEIMHFLTCLRTIRFDFRCFGSFPTSHITSDDEEEEDDDDDDDDEDENYRKPQVGMKGNYGNESSRTVFSKLFMALEENKNSIGLVSKEEGKERERSYGEESIDPSCAPPSNALLLMRSRSAPAKSWLEEREEEEDDEEREVEEEKKAKLVEEEEEKRKKRESLVDLMRYDSDFHKLSCDIAKETWVVGGMRDSLSRSRSWKR